MPAGRVLKRLLFGRRLATEERIWTWPGTQPTDTPGVRRVELTVGDATLGFSPPEVARLVGALLPDADSSRRPRT